MFQGQHTKKFLLVYSAATALCALFDGLNFLIFFMWFNVPGHEYSELIMLWAALLNLLMDIYFVVTVVAIKERMHATVGTFIADALLGYTNKMNREICHGLELSE